MPGFNIFVRNGGREVMNEPGQHESQKPGDKIGVVNACRCGDGCDHLNDIALQVRKTSHNKSQRCQGTYDYQCQCENYRSAIFFP